jgi:hypothetical protein
VQDGFFYSYTYNLAATLQTNMENGAKKAAPFDSMFVWNEFLTRRACQPIAALAHPTAPRCNAHRSSEGNAMLCLLRCIGWPMSHVQQLRCMRYYLVGIGSGLRLKRRCTGRFGRRWVMTSGGRSR